jgi:hypothetical protein
MGDGRIVAAAGGEGNSSGGAPFLPDRLLIARVFVHDATKFRETNQHHPEYWGGLHRMPDIAVAEMVCDW